MVQEEVYSRKPIGYHGTIPLFSSANDYIRYYEKIAGDHMEENRRPDAIPGAMKTSVWRWIALLSTLYGNTPCPVREYSTWGSAWGGRFPISLSRAALVWTSASTISRRHTKKGLTSVMASLKKCHTYQDYLISLFIQTC